MITELSQEAADAADLDALNAINARAQELFTAGKMTPAAFEELRAEGLKAAGGFDSLLQTLDMFRPS